MPAHPARRLSGGLAVLGLAAGLLSGCGGGISRQAAIEQYECSQINVATALANDAADETAAWQGVSLSQAVARLEVPALRPVPIASASGTGLPWGEMTAAQRDTWSAWKGLDGGGVITRERLPTDPVATCAREPVPPRPDDGRSTGQVARAAAGSIYASDVAVAIDRIVRGNHDAALVDVRQRRQRLSRRLRPVQEPGLPPLRPAARAPHRRLRRARPHLARVPDRARGAPGAPDPRPHEDRPSPIAPGGANDAWAAEIGATDAMLFVVYGLPGERRLRPTIASFRDAVVRAIDGNGSVAAELDREHPTQPLSTLGYRSTYSYAIVAGYVRNGVVTPPSDTVRDGLLTPPADLRPDGLSSLDSYLVDDEKAHKVFGSAEDAADDAYTDRIIGCCAGAKRP